MLLAQLLTLCAPASSNTVWSVPLVKPGGSLTAVAVIVNVCAALVSLPPLAVPPLSCATMVTVAVPLALAAVWYVSAPVEPLIVGTVVKNLALVLYTELEYVIDWITNDPVWLAS